MSSLSLWLLPPPAIRASCQMLIARLAQRLGTPEFEPHVTLAGTTLSETEASERVRQLAQQLPPLAIRLAELQSTDAYFRCVYARAELSPALRHAYTTACTQLNQTPGDFLPHVSLVYGDLDADTRKSLIAELGGRLDVSFIADRVALYDPTGSPPTWRRVADWPLTGT